MLLFWPVRERVHHLVSNKTIGTIVSYHGIDSLVRCGIHIFYSNYAQLVTRSVPVGRHAHSIIYCCKAENELFVLLITINWTNNFLLIMSIRVDVCKFVTEYMWWEWEVPTMNSAYIDIDILWTTRSDEVGVNNSHSCGQCRSNKAELLTQRREIYQSSKKSAIYQISYSFLVLVAFSGLG